MNQIVIHVVAIPRLQIVQWRQRILLKPVAIMLHQRCPVRHDPGFHASGHKENLLIGCPGGFVPLVAAIQMIPSLFEIYYRVFAVNQHRDVVPYL